MIYLGIGILLGGKRIMLDPYSCICKYQGCNKFHNNVNGNGYCKLHNRIKRLFSWKKYEKLEGVMLPL